MLKKKAARFLSLILATTLSFTSVFTVSAADTAENTETQITAGTSDDENAYAIYPIPQSITYDENHTAFTLEEVSIVAEDGIDSYTKKYLKEVLDEYGVVYTENDTIQSEKTNILLGIENSNGVVDVYANENITISDAGLYKKNDAYILDAADGCIVIEGKDTDSVFYGIATLKMMFSSFAGEKFLTAHIEDYATVATRGYIEGFYGSWDWESRADLMKFARDYKINSYVYAAKNDSYHTSSWNELYPVEWLTEFEKIVQLGKETKVEFGWSVHMGSFFSGLDLSDTTTYEDRYGQLMDKFDQLYKIGVRDFDILNDDFGSGSHEDVVTVINRINADLKTKYADDPCNNISYCPQGYNRSWSGDGTELAALQNLDEDIYLYWTGDDVNAPITQDTIDYVTEQSGHAPDYWLNYPVNEHATAGIFLGDITYYARDNVTGLAAFHSNPCRYPYASEVGLYQLAALVWNNNNYSEHAQDVWESAFDYLQPEVKDSYFTIANHIANAPNSSRVPGFNESEYLTETLETLTALFESGQAIKASAQAQTMLQEFKDIIAAIEDFRTNCVNTALIAELDPWLNSLDDLAHAGLDALESIIALEGGDASAAWENLSSASKYYDTAYTYTNAANNTAKAGSKRIYPFVTKLINVAKNNITPVLNPSDTTVTPTFIGVFGGAERSADANALLMYDGDESTYAGWQIVQQAGDYFGLDLGRVINVTDITILQGQEDGHHDIFHDATLQCSTDKENWTNITDAVVSENGCLITADELNIQARYVRYYLNTQGTETKPDYWTFVREFTVNRVIEEHDRVYTNVEELKQTPLTLAGTEIGVRELSNLTLEPGEYIGVKLENPETVLAFVKEIGDTQGLTFEYSFNETEWLEAGELTEHVGVKYLRLMNKTQAPITFDLEKIGMDVQNLKAEPSLLTSTVGSGLSAGSYDNVFDGDLTTYALTGSNPSTGNYVTFDLGKTIDVYDVTLTTTDGNQHLYNAKIQISKDNSTWTDIAVVTGDESFTPPYRYINADGNGEQARYLRIYFTGNSSYQLQLHEIQMNQEVDAAAVSAELISSMSGNLTAVTDKDVSTLFAANAAAGDYIEYRITDNTNVSQISVLQGAAGTGKAYAVTPSGNQELGTLDQSVSIFDTSAIDTITAIRIEWDAAEEVAIHELSISAGASSSDDIGEYAEPIIADGETEPVVRNLAPGKAVTVSGTSDGNKDHVNDEDTSTKWDSNVIKSGTTDTGDAWIYIDLGEEETYEISQIVVRFFNKIYPTSWVIQVSEDANEWIDVTDVMTKENNGSTHPVEMIDFETPVTGRYVRLYFNTLNTAAAGNGVGVTEFEIYGKEKTDNAISENANIGLNKTVIVSGTSNGVKESINDGDSSSKWDSDLIKGANKTSDEAWFVIDLGTKANLIDGLNVAYFNKVYPTIYAIQISNDNANWTSVQTLTKEHNGATYPIDDITFETPLSARYIKMLFTEMNEGAAGHGIGINEAQILGRYIYADASVNAVEVIADIILEQNAEFDEALLPEYVKTEISVAGVSEAVNAVVPVIWDTTELDTSTPGVYTLHGELSLNGITNPDNVEVLVQVTVEKTVVTNPFEDVFETDFYYNPVLWAVGEGVTSGKSATLFAPSEFSSRGDVVTFMWRAAGRPEPASTTCTFTDVSEGAYYYKAVLWAVEQGITSGTSETTFEPSAECTRAQVVSFLWRVAGRTAPTSTAHSFIDVPENAYYKNAVLWAVENKITAGTSETTFEPDAKCTRGQIVTFLYRHYGK